MRAKVYDKTDLIFGKKIYFIKGNRERKSETYPKFYDDNFFNLGERLEATTKFRCAITDSKKKEFRSYLSSKKLHKLQSRIGPYTCRKYKTSIFIA